MPKELTREQLIKIVRDALKSVGDAKLLKDGVPEKDLMALELDTFFASPDNLDALVRAIKKGVKGQKGAVVLGEETVKEAATFEDLLIIVDGQQQT